MPFILGIVYLFYTDKNLYPLLKDSSKANPIRQKKHSTHSFLLSCLDNFYESTIVKVIHHEKIDRISQEKGW